MATSGSSLLLDVGLTNGGRIWGFMLLRFRVHLAKEGDWMGFVLNDYPKAVFVCLPSSITQNSHKSLRVIESQSFRWNGRMRQPLSL